MKKSRLFTVMSVIIFIAGAGMVVYPYLAEYINSLARSEAVADYDGIADRMAEERVRGLLESAEEYNQRLSETGQQGEDYYSQLDVDGKGMMGYVEIPKINCILPMFHSTDEKVMKNSVGHLAGSSLPIGGEGTHSVLSAHRGELSSRLFTDLDKLETGDIFIIRVLGRRIVYEIESIITVLPEQTETLAIEKDRDLCTLVTCTPFGINTHRLLVRGHRTEYHSDIPVVKEENRLAELSVFIVLSAVVLGIVVCLIAVIAVRKHFRKKAQQ